jgi:MOSC domain-containing protein YiiM
VLAVCRDGVHRFSKEPVDVAEFVVGLGLAGDAHAGRTIQHLSRLRRDPTAPNLRQVHVIAAELLAELRERGFDVAPGRLGENVTTTGVELLALPTGTMLRLGATAVVKVTGLRNPCLQLDRYQDGLQKAVLDRAADGTLIRRAGVMGVVVAGGVVRPGDAISVTLPSGDPRPLEPV